MFAYNNVKGFAVLYHPQFSPTSDMASQDRRMDGLGGAIEVNTRIFNAHWRIDAYLIRFTAQMGCRTPITQLSPG